MREVLEYQIGSTRMVGTHHVPLRQDPAQERRDANLGVFLINFAQSSRAGIGDMSARIGDRLAERGYPVFRFDMPGLGDTRGPAPEIGEALWHFIRDGGHTRYASALVHRLREDYGLEKIVLGGLCAGAVTAIYTAARCPEAVPGVLLFEPVFHRCEEKPGRDPLRRIAGNGNGNGAGSAERPRQYTRAHEWAQARLSSASPDHWVRSLYVGAKMLRDCVRSPVTPLDANRQLRRAWDTMVHANTKVLLLNSGVEGRAMHNLYFLGLRFAQLADWHVVPATNHLMVVNGGREAVVSHVETWMGQRFPR